MESAMKQLTAQLEEVTKNFLKGQAEKTEDQTNRKDGFMRVLTIGEAAKIYKMSRWTLHRLRKAGKIKAYKKERKVLLDQDSLENFIKSTEEKYEFAG